MDRNNHYFRQNEDQDSLTAFYDDVELALERLAVEYIPLSVSITFPAIEHSTVSRDAIMYHESGGSGGSFLLF
jgi:hypothetical protein